MESAIIGGLLSIVAALFGGLFSIYSPRRNARREAGRQLIAEFAAVEASFNRIAIADCHAIDPTLREAFSRLEEKINIFKSHMFWPWQKVGFRKAWVEYYNNHGDERCQSYLNYLPFNEQPPTLRHRNI